jgi:hypothetical protein
MAGAIWVIPFPRIDAEGVIPGGARLLVRLHHPLKNCY